MVTAPPETAVALAPPAPRPREPVAAESRVVPRKAAAPSASGPAGESSGAAAVPPARPERPPAAEPRIYQLNELPDDVRRQLPQLTAGGAMYSDKPASRMLIINGQLFHEGDALNPNLTLRQIRLKSAVLEFRGYRYELNY